METEKKGDMLNQLAIIADLIEKVNITFESSSITFNLNDDEFKRVYNYISRKNGEKFVDLKEHIKTYSINIGEVNVIINKNNV